MRIASRAVQLAAMFMQRKNTQHHFTVQSDIWTCGIANYVVKNCFKPLAQTFGAEVLKDTTTGQQKANVTTITAYCACVLCCGPDANGITASGVRPREGVTVAAPRSVPFGTRVYIATIGWRTVQDRTARRYDGRYDVYFNRHADAKKFGIKQRKVYK